MPPARTPLATPPPHTRNTIHTRRCILMYTYCEALVSHCEPLLGRFCTISHFVSTLLALSRHKSQHKKLSETTGIVHLFACVGVFICVCETNDVLEARTSHISLLGFVSFFTTAQHISCNKRILPPRCKYFLELLRWMFKSRLPYACNGRCL